MTTLRDARSLVKAACNGDGEAFAVLVAPSLAPAFSVATIITGSRSDGADAVQDALVAAWRGLSSLREPLAFSSWFRQLAVRSALRTARRRRRIQVVELDPGQADQTGSASVERAVQRRMLSRAFAQLDARDRAVLALRYAADLSIEDVAVWLAIPAGTVKSRVHSATERLRAAYEAEERR